MPTANRLYDVATRHQLYLEGLKEGQLSALASIFAQMEVQLRNATTGLSVDNLDNLTRRQLGQYITTLEEIQTTSLRFYVRRLMAFLREYLQADRVIYNDIIADETENALVAMPPVNDLVAQLDGSILSANGMTVEAAITALITASNHSIRRRVQMGVANLETPRDMLTRLLGTAANNNRDGLLTTTYNSFATLVRTVLQGAFTVLRDAVYQLYTDRYMWSSIIDGVTTQICRSRNGRVYVYGQGPRPPAHYNCRSSAVPVIVGIGAPSPADSWFDWLTAQPRQLWADILPTGVYNGLKAGQLTAKELPKFDKARPLSLERYRSIADTITR